jgi:hypothetical protein
MNHALEPRGKLKQRAGRPDRQRIEIPTGGFHEAGLVLGECGPWHRAISFSPQFAGRAEPQHAPSSLPSIGCPEIPPPYGPPDRPLVNVTSRIAKPSRASWLATNRAGAPRRWQTLEEILWGPRQAIGIQKSPEYRAVRQPNSDRGTGPPFATALMQRARRMSLIRPKGRKSRSFADGNFSILANRPRPVSST